MGIQSAKPGRLFLAAAALCAVLSPTLSQQKAPPVPVPVWALREAGRVQFAGPLNLRAVLSGTLAVFTTRAGSIYGVDAARRAVAWHFAARAPIPGPPALRGEAIAAADEKDTVYCLKTDGSLVWEFSCPDLPAQGPVFSGSGIVVALRSGTLLALGVDRPRELWRTELGTDKLGGLASWSGGVAVSLPGGIVRIIGPDGRPLRDIDARGELVGPLFAEGDRLYFSRVDGFLCSADPSSGSLHWKVRLGGSLAAPPTRVGGRLFLAAENGVLFALGRGGGDVLWWRPLPSRSAYRPVLWQGRLVGSSRSPGLTAYFPKTGVLAGEYPGALVVTSDPAAVGDTLLVSAYEKESGQGTLLFLQPPAPPAEAPGKIKGVKTP